MKRLIIALIFIATASTIYSQSTWRSFWRPVPSDLFPSVETIDSNIRADYNASVWLFRPAITLTAVQWNWDKVAKQFSAATFQSAGLGVGYAHYVPSSDGPFNNYGFNALLLLGQNISAAGTFSGLGIINLGVCYNFSVKQVGLLTGVQLKF